MKENVAKVDDKKGQTSAGAYLMENAPPSPLGICS